MAVDGWPEDWAQRLKGQDCPICRALGLGDNEFWKHVHDGELAEVHLERRTRLPGYCVVVWKGRHVAEPTELDADEATGYWQEVLAVGRAVETLFRPVKINYQLLGNWVPHLHMHVLPRYLDDPAPGGPLAWPDIFRSQPLPDDELAAQAHDLRRLLTSG